LGFCYWLVSISAYSNLLHASVALGTCDPLRNVVCNCCYSKESNWRERIWIPRLTPSFTTTRQVGNWSLLQLDEQQTLILCCEELQQLCWKLNLEEKL
jgi:hypothetical protein